MDLAVVAVTPGRPRWQRACLATAERALALLMLVLSLPLMLVAVVLVKLTSRGPALYTQIRVGRGGVPFTLYKLRTMVHNCECLTGPCWSLPGDRRVTGVGRFLRRTHLDEVPQLWNVLRGEMTLVGPRPERPEFVPHLDREIPHYRERLAVRPGLTGPAQLWLPPDTDLASVRRKLTCDLFYLQHRGPWLDLRILVATGLYLGGMPAELACALLRIPRGEPGKLEEAGKVSPREANSQGPGLVLDLDRSSW
jgi:lipopolysaccharide/colanic/teichoic acid biosynthesis glycosyltransferase